MKYMLIIRGFTLQNQHIIPRLIRMLHGRNDLGTTATSCFLSTVEKFAVPVTCVEFT